MIYKSAKYSKHSEIRNHNSKIRNHNSLYYYYSPLKYKYHGYRIRKKSLH